LIKSNPVLLLLLLLLLLYFSPPTAAVFVAVGYLEVRIVPALDGIASDDAVMVGNMMMIGF